MSIYDLSAQELAHIRAMIALLDDVLQDNRDRQVTPVASPDYWRARIGALRARHLSPALEAEVHALMERLDALDARHECDRHDTQHSPGGNPHC